MGTQEVEQRINNSREILFELLQVQTGVESTREKKLLMLTMESILTELGIDLTAQRSIVGQASDILCSAKEYKNLTCLVEQSGNQVTIEMADSCTKLRFGEYVLALNPSPGGSSVSREIPAGEESQTLDELLVCQAQSTLRDPNLVTAIIESGLEVLNKENIIQVVAAIPANNLYKELMNAADESQALEVIASILTNRISTCINSENGGIGDALYRYLVEAELAKITSHSAAKERLRVRRSIAEVVPEEELLNHMVNILTQKESQGLYEQLISAGVQIESHDGESIDSLLQFIQKSLPYLLVIEPIDPKKLDEVVSIDNYKGLAASIERFFPSDNLAELSKILKAIYEEYTGSEKPDFIKLVTSNGKVSYTLGESFQVGAAGLDAALQNRTTLLGQLGTTDSEGKLKRYLEDTVYRLKCQSGIWQILERRITGLNEGNVLAELIGSLGVEATSQQVGSISELLARNLKNRNSGSIVAELSKIEGLISEDEITNARNSVTEEEATRIVSKFSNDEARINQYYKEGIIIQKTKHILGSKTGSLIQEEISRFSKALHFYFGELNAVRQSGAKSRQDVFSIVRDLEQITNQVNKPSGGKLYLPFYYALCKSVNPSRVGLSQIIDIGELDMLHRLASIAERSTNLLGIPVEWVLVNEADEAFPLMHTGPEADGLVRQNVQIAQEYINYLAQNFPSTSSLVTFRSIKSDVRGILRDRFEELHRDAVAKLKEVERHRQVAFAMASKSDDPATQILAAITGNENLLPQVLITQASDKAVYFDGIMALRTHAANMYNDDPPPQYSQEVVIPTTITAKDSDSGAQKKVILKPADSFAGRNGFPTHRIGVFYNNQYGQREVCLMQLWEVLLYPSAFKLHVNGSHILGIELLSEEMIAEQAVQRKLDQMLKWSELSMYIN